MNYIHLTSRPALVPHARLQIDRLSGEAVLLYPEGIMELNATSYAVLRLCDGTRDILEIERALAEEFEIEPMGLRTDLLACLEFLHTRNLLLFLE
jgi:pyrroloquinoline quinone biosynthesis protein D